MNPRNFFTELKRRNVLRAAAFYAASAWLLVQIATQVFPFFHVAEWVVRWIVAAAAIGFPFAMLFSWFYEWTPQGIQRESEVAPDDSVTRPTNKKFDRWIIAILLLAVVLLLTDKLIFRPDEKTAAATVISEKSIAVLPFENLSDEKANAYFAEGIQDEILTRVSEIPELKVISRTSSRRFKDSTESMRAIAQKLGVVNILEGSVQRTHDQVHVNVQLIDAQQDVHLWAQTYDRKLDDIFAIEAEIARNVAKVLEAKLTGAAERALAARPTKNPEAHQLYLQGHYYNERGTEADYRQAIGFYKQAIRFDPNYAQAHTGLSIASVNLARKFLTGVEAQKVNAEARSAAEAALALEPDLAAAHNARALVLDSVDFNWTEAETEYRRALELEPNNDPVKTSLAGLLATLGRPDQAVELARQELANDPLCASCYNYLSGYLCSLGRLDDAEEAIQQAIRLQPGHTDFHTQLTAIAILRGDAKAALSAAQQEIADGGWQEIALALAQQISGDPVAADAALNALIDHQADDAGYQIAQVYALRKEPDKVFEWLERAWSNRDPGISGLLFDPFLIRYKDDSRFAPFCRKVGLPPLALGAKS